MISRLEGEVERLEEVKKANIEKFVTNLRDELHQLWDECYYSEQQRYRDTPPALGLNYELGTVIGAQSLEAFSLANMT